MVYPVNLNLKNKRCAVLGGGSVGERKVLTLLNAGAEVTVISPKVSLKLQEKITNAEITYIAKNYTQGMLEGYFLVICATDNQEVNHIAALEAKENKALVNVVDDKSLCDFSVPSQIVRGDVLITVSTNGKSPAFTKYLRKDLQSKYGDELGIYLEILAEARDQLKNSIVNTKDRELFWQQNIEEILKLIKDGKRQEAEEKIINAIGCTGFKS